MRDEQGRVSHFIEIQRDLAEEKRAEAQLVAQREAKPLDFRYLDHMLAVILGQPKRSER